MEIDGIEVFVEVVEAQSFAKAAQRLRMPPATVSAKIARLERRLGVTLIQRTTRRLRVTGAGETYYGYCARAVAEMREAQQQLSNTIVEPAGRLRITAPVGLSQTVLPPLVERLLRLHPKVSVTIIATNKYLDLLAEGIDIAIRGGELKDSRLVARTFFAGRFGLWASRDYVASHAPPKKPEDLAKHAFVGFSGTHPRPGTLRSGRRSIPIPTTARIQCDDLESVRIFVARGNGIGLLAERVGAEDGLVRILPEFATSAVAASLVYPAQKFVSPAVRAFIEVATGTSGGRANRATASPSGADDSGNRA